MSKITTIPDWDITPTQEPTAWKVGFLVFTSRNQTEANIRDPFLSPIPLYAAPLPLVLRELSDMEIRDALRKFFTELRTRPTISEYDMAWLRGVANAIIKAAREAV